MPITGRFVADFSDFQSAVQKAEVSLKGLESNAGKVGGALNKMVDSFSGRKLIQDANLVVESVRLLGGASQLTVAEQLKVNKTVTEAIEKYAALGQQAPQAMRDLAAATAATVRPMTSLDSHLKDIQQHLSAFSGDKIIKEAMAMARAVEQVGGASKLTATEQAKVNAVVTEAISKYAALGKTAPASLQQLAAATRATAGPMSSLEDHLKQIQKHVQAFSGDKIIQEAAQIASAVEKVGGASKLTAAEQANVNRTVIEALAKYKALGKEAPASLHALEQATRQLTPPLEQTHATLNKIWASLKGAAGLVGIAFSAHAVVGFVKSVFDAASEIKDVSMQLGISAEAAQRFKFAAEQTGTTLDSVGRAVNFMNKALSDGDKGTVGALKSAGLSFHQIRVMRPEDAFDAIARAVAGIEDPMLQAEVAAKLFSKSAVDLLPGIKEGFVEIGKAANVMSDDTINSLEAAQDAWGALADSVIIATGTMIAHSMRAVDEITAGWDHAAQFIENAIKFGPGVAMVMADMAAKAKVMTQELTDAQKAEIRFLVEAGGTAKDIGVLFGAAGKAAEKYAATLKKVGKDLRLTDDEVRQLDDSLRKLEAAKDKAAAAGVKAFQDWHKTIKDLNFDMRILVAGRLQDLGDKARSVLSEATSSTIGWLKILQNGLPVIKGLGDGLDKVGEQIKVSFVPVKTTFEELRDQADMIAGSMSNLGQAIGGMFGALVQKTGTAISAIGDLADSTDKYRRLLADLKAAGQSTFAATASYAMSAAASIVTLFQVSKALFDSFTKSDDQLRQLKRQALDAAGGMQVLRDQALLAGISVDAIFDLKDQTPENFQRQMQNMERSIATVTARLERLGLTWRDLNQDIRQGQIDINARQILADISFLTKDMLSTTTKNSAEAIELLMGKVTKAVAGSLNQLIVDAVKTGTKIPKALEPIIQHLIKIGGLTDAAARAMLGLADDATPALDDIRDAAARYGKTLDDLGPQVKQLQITEIANQIVKDWKTLSSVGSDTAAIMGKAIQGVVTDALKLGLTLPESMRPIIQAMIDAGFLTDEFGGKLTDTGRLNFAVPLTEKIDDLILALRDLIDHMSKVGDEAERSFGRARGAAEALGRAIPRGSVPGDTGAPSVPRPEGPGGQPSNQDDNARTRDDAPGTPPGSPGRRNPSAADIAAMTASARAPEFADSQAFGRVLPFPSPALTPAETALTASRPVAESQASAAGSTMTIILEQDGQRSAEFIVPYIPDAVKRYGLA